MNLETAVLRPVAPVYTARDRQALAHFAQFAPVEAGRLQLSLPRYAAARVGTAATLRAIDAAAGGGYYDVPEQATQDDDAARELFSSEWRGLIHRQRLWRPR